MRQKRIGERLRKGRVTITLPVDLLKRLEEEARKTERNSLSALISSRLSTTPPISDDHILVIGTLTDKAKYPELVNALAVLRDYLTINSISGNLNFDAHVDAVVTTAIQGPQLS